MGRIHDLMVKNPNDGLNQGHIENSSPDKRVKINTAVNHWKLQRGIKFAWLALWLGYSSVSIKNMAIADDLIEKDWVVRIDDSDRSGPVAVHFGQHAAIYFLRRDDPHFSSFLSLLQESQAKKTFVRFQFNVAGQLFTFIEADNP